MRVAVHAGLPLLLTRLEQEPPAAGPRERS